MSELTGPGVSTCERHKSRASRQKSGRRRPMRRQSGFFAGNGERDPNLTAIFHPPVFPHGLPDIGAVAPEAAELDIVAMRLLAVAEHEDELMPRAVERTHAAVALDPDAEVQKIEGYGAAGG